MGALTDKIKEVLADMAELQVTTLTGTIKSNAKIPTAASDLNFKWLLSGTNVDVSVVASTEVKLDGDINQFIAKNASTDHLDRHDQAVQTGKDIRSGYVALAKELIG